ncbi:acyltransferase [Salinispira pacifica]|uniref:acyltransferase n=1 Tax=Salinispira pacifica TaxID=1307761 RepID=UPI00059B7074|nr:acyltransferase [Salinispira pacifica]
MNTKQSKIHNTAIIYDNVIMGDNVEVGAYCIIGEPFQGSESQIRTIIGNNAKIRSHSIIYAGNQIGNNFNTGHHVMIRELNTIGDDVSIGSQSCVEHHISIANGVRIHSQVFIPEFTILEDSSWIGPNVVLTNAKYPRSKNVKEKLSGVIVEESAMIGANVTVLPGIKIGKKSLIGSGSVVVHNADSGAIYVGNPARKISRVEDKEGYRK